MNNTFRQIAAVFCVVLSAALALPVLSARAQEQVTTERVTATLMPEREAIAPGESIWVGLKLEMAEGWHTYWRNPGDSGLATTIDWQLPPGIEVGPIQWPAPERQPYGPLMNFGYSDEVTLLARLSVAPDVPAGNVVIAARSTWLVCADICVPEDGSFTLPLQIAPAAPQASTLAGAHLNAVADSLPAPVPGMVSAALTGDTLIVDAEWPDIPNGEVVFFPYPTYLMDNVAEQKITPTAAGFRIEVATVPDPEYGATLGGLFKVIGDTGVTAVAFENAPLTVGAAPGLSTAQAPVAADMTLIAALLFAFIGGVILNLMPCVLPVLSIKALAVVKHGGGGTARRDAIAYTLGIMASFALLVGVLLALQAGGESLGWGFQLQSPGFVSLLAFLMLAVGLSLSGVFNIGTGLTDTGSGWVRSDGPLGSFLTGVLAAVVATPCTAPFMAPAIGFALTQPAGVVFLIFESLALGLAAPFLLIGLVPALARILPKPGAWMDTFKQVLAFPMYGAAAWLVWVVAQQVDPMGLAATLTGMICVAFAAWLYGRISSQGTARPVPLTLAAIAVAGALALASVPQPLASNGADASVPANATWEPYSPDRLAALRAEGKPVFVNFTAAWCITCLMNERAVISMKGVQDAITGNGIVYMKADWTNRDPAITAALDSFGRSGVPLYVLYDRSGQPHVQPQILTPDAFTAALNAL